MATSYISATLKTQLQGIIDNVHETFARTITVYEEGERVLIAASSTYNNVLLSSQQINKMKPDEGEDMT